MGTHPVSIVYFDGVCGLCNRFVGFMLRRKRASRFRFAPLQGKRAQSLNLNEAEIMESIVLEIDGKTYRQSAAVLRILVRLGGVWVLMGFFFIFPPFIRDAVYRWLARNRYQWFGKTEVCRLPDPEEKAFFFD